LQGTINTTQQPCPFCAAPIDRDVAEATAAIFSRVNQACSDASYLKIMAGMVLTFFILRYIPLLGLIGNVGFLFLMFAVPVMAIRWWVKFGSLKTTDFEFRGAKQTVLIVAGFSLFVLVLVATITAVTWPR
jgi:hypothetical protein